MLYSEPTIPLFCSHYPISDEMEVENDEEELLGNDDAGEGEGQGNKRGERKRMNQLSDAQKVVRRPALAERRN